MRLVWRRFDQIGLSRTVQLINKTNQFNLTTRRTTEDEIVGIMNDPSSVGLQLRLLDRFGDNGIISIVIGTLTDDAFVIDTWLMSCRVLGRQVESATLNLVADQARRLGASRLVGQYVPSERNAMVKDHYRGLGFHVTGEDDNGRVTSALELATFEARATPIEVQEG